MLSAPVTGKVSNFSFTGLRFNNTWTKPGISQKTTASRFSLSFDWCVEWWVACGGPCGVAVAACRKSGHGPLHVSVLPRDGGRTRAVSAAQRRPCVGPDAPHACAAKWTRQQTPHASRHSNAWTRCRGTSAWQPWRLRFAWDGYGAVRSAVLPCPFGLALFRGSGTLELRRRRAWRSGAVGGEPACSQQRLVQAEVLPGVQCGCVGRLPGWTQRRVACPGPAALSCHR